jgi:hypothetical protein
MSDGNFNIKENMKAGQGIKFSEGINHVDNGPSYISENKLTLKEYKIRHGTNAEF